MRRIGIAVWVLLVIALFGLPAGVQAQGADDGLVAEWHFDEGSGSVLADSSGNGNDGVIHGATWVEGKQGMALEFDGVDDYVKIFDDQSSDIHNEITVGAWINADAIQPDKYPDPLSKDGPGGRSWFIRPADDFPAVSMWMDGTRYDVMGITDLRGAGWSHIAVVYNGAEIKYYINGGLDDSTPATGSVDVTLEPLQIGNGYPDGSHHFKGNINKVIIYDKALSPEEIRALYEGVQLSLTKSAAPHSTKQGQTTTITLTAKNTGTTELTDIEVSDAIPSDLTFVSGETSKNYISLRPNDSREFQYVLQPSDAGTFNLDPATATYADEEGNYHTTESETATITVIPSTDQSPTPQTTKNPSTDISTASVHLHGEKTDVVLGEDVLLKLSAVNIIGNPTMHVQVIIIPPSGWSVTSSEFAKSGAGQYTTTYEIEEGVGRDIEVRIVPNQIGDDFQVQGRIIYYFGDDSDAREDHMLTLPITVRAEAEQGAERTESSSESKEASAPGFAAVIAILGLLLAY
ncbi:MAG: hypothetical protein C4B59_09675 [Candidatus Methanogaster sp.]|uniref:Uncharacterized protein n=1 Tax=Candidatus Methanogaster sp. TaxID=3386292 RepID=A0AC61L201_9EURY|nr:MAG: hypothetical protein C4B59_09675 [ANME-2 cluster archaeon]